MTESTRMDLFRESSGMIITEIVRLEWDDGEALLINDSAALSINGEEYTPCGMAFTPPSSEEGEAELRIDDIDGKIAGIMQMTDSASITISVIERSAPEDPLDGPAEFSVSSFTASSSDGSCTLSLSARSRLSYGLSKLTYSSASFPGLFG